LQRKRGPELDYHCKAATHWYRRAEEMRVLAEDAQDATVRSMMLRIAANYERRSLNANLPAAQHSIMFQRADLKSESVPETSSKPA
jgi:hypothetical protein